ncbi:MAG: protease [Gammaproteobacteria bacterium]|nr:MAG: protease [Gammaproteobacteria bacterium]
MLKNFLKQAFWPAVAGVLGALLLLQHNPGGQSLSVQHKTIDSYADAVEVAAPSVVNIYTRTIVVSQDQQLTPSTPQERVQQSLGSGVIMSDKGYILTNNHVIDGADQILVLLYDGREAMATTVGSDPETDLAVLHVDLPNMQQAQIANEGELKVGDVVLSIGNPLGYGHSVSQGIVSALGRYGLQASRYEDYIQTDTTINRGNSGGALIDTRGRLLGINTLIGSVGISLAIPVNQALFVMNDLIEYGKVIRGWLGVSVQPLPTRKGDGSVSQVLGVLGVSPDSPADRANIRRGDIITHINGEPVVDGRLTMHRIALLRPGDHIDVRLLRDGKAIDTNTVIGIRPTAS